MRLTGYNILIVDDNMTFARSLSLMIRTILGDRLRRLDLAANGKEAVELAHKVGYDMIFMDINMPEMNGISATKLINKNFYRTTVIIAVSYDKSIDSLSMMLESGARTMIYKDELTVESLEGVFDIRVS